MREKMNKAFLSSLWFTWCIRNPLALSLDLSWYTLSLEVWALVSSLLSFTHLSYCVHESCESKEVKLYFSYLYLVIIYIQCHWPKPWKQQDGCRMHLAIHHTGCLHMLQSSTPLVPLVLTCTLHWEVLRQAYFWWEVWNQGSAAWTAQWPQGSPQLQKTSQLNNGMEKLPLDVILIRLVKSGSLGYCWHIGLASLARQWTWD